VEYQKKINISLQQAALELCAMVSDKSGGTGNFPIDQKHGNRQ
jgi:hypothetical protein